MILLEQRLDNVVYRLGLATTRRQARQLVNHGHILVDGKRVDIPSYHVEVGQVISVREKSQNISTIKEAIEATTGRTAFVSFDDEKLEGSLTRLPERDELTAEVDEALVVEFYNQKTIRIFTRSCDRNLVTASFCKLLEITSSERSQNFTEIRQAIFELSFFLSLEADYF